MVVELASSCKQQMMVTSWGEWTGQDEYMRHWIIKLVTSCDFLYYYYYYYTHNTLAWKSLSLCVYYHNSRASNVVPFLPVTKKNKCHVLVAYYYLDWESCELLIRTVGHIYMFVAFGALYWNVGWVSSLACWSPWVFNNRINKYIHCCSLKCTICWIIILYTTTCYFASRVIFKICWEMKRLAEIFPQKVLNSFKHT